MIVLDADSIMTGRALVELVALMEKNPGVGLIQTAPRIVNGETLFARVQSFASRFTARSFRGLNYWQQHEGNFWATTPSSASSPSWITARCRSCRDANRSAAASSRTISSRPR